MCHDWWMRREMRRQERFDEELRHLFDERERSEPPMPIVEHEQVEEATDPQPDRVEAGAPS